MIHRFKPLLVAALLFAPHPLIAQSRVADSLAILGVIRDRAEAIRTLNVERQAGNYADDAIWLNAFGVRRVGKDSIVSRAISDFSYCTYLSDLAVDVEYQRRGIGRELIRHTHNAAGLHTSLILLAAPGARSYYPHVGMRPHDSCWLIDRASSS